MELIKPGLNIPFTNYRHIAVALSTIVNIVVLVLLFTKGPRLGVDFAGGAVVQVKFFQKVSGDQGGAGFGQLGSGDPWIQNFWGKGFNEIFLRVVKTSSDVGALCWQ